MHLCFEDKFMEIQTELISLCMEVTGSEVDKVFAYASIDKKSRMFNAFFEKEGKVLTLNELNIVNGEAMGFLKTGTQELEKIKRVCEENQRKIPTEIKMYYDVKTGRFDAEYKYDEECLQKMSSGEIFMKWYEEIKGNEMKGEE